MADRLRDASSGIVIHGHLTRNRSGRSARAGLVLDVYVDGWLACSFAPMFPYWRHVVPFLSKGQRLRLPPGPHEVEVRQVTDRGTQVALTEVVLLKSDAWVDVHCRTVTGGRVTTDNPISRLEVVA